jgi:hypothetical protein
LALKSADIRSRTKLALVADAALIGGKIERIGAAVDGRTAGKKCEGRRQSTIACQGPKERIQRSVCCPGEIVGAREREIADIRDADQIVVACDWRRSESREREPSFVPV